MLTSKPMGFNHPQRSSIGTDLAEFRRFSDELIAKMRRLSEKSAAETRPFSTTAEPWQWSRPLDQERLQNPCRFGMRLKLILKAQPEWLYPNEVFEIIHKYDDYELATKPLQLPPSGLLFLYDRRVLKSYKRDGYNWRKQKDGKTVTEGHERLKVKDRRTGATLIHGQLKNDTYYWPAAVPPQPSALPVRRTLCLLWHSRDLSHIVLVNYLDIGVKNTDAIEITSQTSNETTEDDDYEAEDNGLEAEGDAAAGNIDFPVKMQSIGGTGRNKRARPDSDGYGMRQKIVIPVDPLDDEMMVLGKDLETLKGFERGSRWFIMAMKLFKVKENRALYKAMVDHDTIVCWLKEELDFYDFPGV